MFPSMFIRVDFTFFSMRLYSLTLCLALFAGSLSGLQAQGDLSDLHGGTGGLWLPANLKALNAEAMQQMGLRLPVDSIYHPDAPTLSDAVVVLDGGSCTAEAVSPAGLLFTNHHCAFDAIAAVSSEAQDRLTDGFWAYSRGEELPIEGSTAGFLVRSEAVTDQVLNPDGSQPDDMDQRIANLQAAAVEGTSYNAEVKPVLEGNEYYLFVYETFRDVRLVGAPPSAIGKFGRDQDNWMWPRHTGDFAILRVYAGPDGKPADYSEDNVPYQPRHHLPISLKGYEVGDFTMIMGYPGSTQRYLTSHAIEQELTVLNPDRITLMADAATLMDQAMREKDAVRIALSSSYAGLMNGYKYYIGQTEMLKRYRIVAQKAKAEAAFQRWVDADPARKTKFGTLLTDLSEALDQNLPNERYYNYLIYTTVHPDVAPNGVFFSYSKLRRLQAAARSGRPDIMAQIKAEVEEAIPTHFEEFIYPLDQKLFIANFLHFYQDLPEALHPDIFEEIASGQLGGEEAGQLTDEAPEPGSAEAAETSFKWWQFGKKRAAREAAAAEAQAMAEQVATQATLSLEQRVRKWTEAAYAQSLATDRGRLESFLVNPDRNIINEDPLLRFANSVLQLYGGTIIMSKRGLDEQIADLRHQYLAALQEMYPNKTFYPDANSTMRVSYGTVQPYEPRDGVLYEHQTTLAGVMEKEDPNSIDYFVPEKLIQLYQDQAYGDYGVDGVMPVCFINTCESSGGSSGSPVVNAEGELIGIAFDGNWEAMTSDIYPIPALTRSIVVDIRYVLFVIEQFAGADNLIKELTIKK
jgi:hypothetical protein